MINLITLITNIFELEFFSSHVMYLVKALKKLVKSDASLSEM